MEAEDSDHDSMPELEDAAVYFARDGNNMDNEMWNAYLNSSAEQNHDPELLAAEERVRASNQEPRVPEDFKRAILCENPLMLTPDIPERLAILMKNAYEVMLANLCDEDRQLLIRVLSSCPGTQTYEIARLFTRTY